MEGVRKLTEILKDADKAGGAHELIGLWNEIARNKYQFPLVEILFGKEHINARLLELGYEYEIK